MVVLPFYPDSFRDTVTSSIFAGPSAKRLPSSLKRSDGRKDLQSPLFPGLYNAE